MEFRTYDYWDDKIWAEAGPIYEKAFAGKGAKPEKVIRNMFKKQICFLQIGLIDEKAVAIALTGKLPGNHGLVIDYMAVREDWQHLGIGREMVDRIKYWAISKNEIERMMIEVEAESTAENLSRIHFWENCGFSLSDYVHHYIWVPEPYKAMYLDLVPGTFLQSGKELFQYIGQFHKFSFQGA
ncbi:GNAT family N-acetyltransferase [Bacillus sp. JJ1764]|uniref:GNAT family N-acetyltransferase n=1 Tax=Bacillus sp. JJ1764 TaxID=3122964 RepID=UPI003000280B